MSRRWIATVAAAGLALAAGPALAAPGDVPAAPAGAAATTAGASVMAAVSPVPTAGVTTAGAPPAPRTEAALTLAEAAALAQAHLPALRAGRARLDAATAEQALVADEAWPTVSLGGTAAYNRLPAVTPLTGIYAMPGGKGLIGFPADGAALDASLAVQHTVFDGFRRQDREAIAAGQRQLAALGLAQARNQAALAVGLAFLQAIEAQGAAAVAADALAQAQAHAQLASVRAEVGTGSQAASLAARAALAGAEGALVQARNAAGLARLELERAAGVDLGDRPLTPAALAPLALDAERELAAGLPRRTELRQRLAERAIAGAQRDLAAHGALPSLTGQAAWAQRNLEPGFFTSGLTVGWQAFDGFRTRDAVAAAEARVAAADAELEGTRRALTLEVRRQVQLRAEARERLAIAARGLAAAEAAFRSATARRDVGTALGADLADARTALAAARQARLRARHDEAAATLRLAAALDLDLPTYLRQAAPAADRP